MKTFTAEVRKGRLVVQETCNLPEGTAVRVSIARSPSKARPAKAPEVAPAADTDRMGPKERASSWYAS